MDRDMKNKLELCRQGLSADHLRKRKDWNGYQVYVPIYKQERISGLPQVVLAKDGVVRLSTYEECFSYMDFTRKK